MEKEEGFWIYKNGRRIFIRGKRYTNGKYKSKKSVSDLYTQNVKELKKKKDIIDDKLKKARAFKQKDEEKKLSDLSFRLSMEAFAKTGAAKIKNQAKRTNLLKTFQKQFGFDIYQIRAKKKENK